MVLMYFDIMLYRNINLSIKCVRIQSHFVFFVEKSTIFFMPKYSLSK